MVLSLGWTKVMETRAATIHHLTIRIAIVVALLGILLGLAVWYGSLPPAPEQGAYPDTHDLGADYDRYVGERVSVSGTVVSTSPVIIVNTYPPGNTLRLRITDLSIEVEKGNHVHVNGVARPNHTIRAKNAVVVPRSGHLYVWSVSFLAGLWVLGRIIRHWRLNTSEWTLQRRETPLARNMDERIRRLIPK